MVNTHEITLSESDYNMLNQGSYLILNASDVEVKDYVLFYKDGDNSAKRHYTESHSEKDRREMKEHANEHMAETMVTLREIWEDADPDLKARMKADLTKLTSEMTV